MARKYCKSCGYGVWKEPGGTAKCSECGTLLNGNLTSVPPVDRSQKAILLAVALFPAFLFSTTVILYSPGQFGLSTHPVAIGGLYGGMFLPPFSAAVVLILLRRGVPGTRNPTWEQIAVGVLAANYGLSVAMLLLANALLPALGIDWPRIGG